MVLNNFIVDTTITWDRVGRSIFENPQAKPGRKLRVQVTNAGVIEDLTGSTLNLGWKNPSNGIEGLDIFIAVDITKGIFEIEYTEGMLSNLGNLKASLQLVNTTVDLLAESNDFVIRVSPSTVNPDASQSIGSWTAFAEILLNEDAREEAAAEHAAAFATYDARINQVEVGVVHPVTNIIASNSDFTTTDGLVLNSATVAAVNNVLTITGTGGANNPNAGFTLLDIPTGNKVYMRVWARVLNAVCQKITLRSELTELTPTVANPVNGQWYELGVIRTKTGALGTALNMAMTHTYADSATANGKQMEVKWAFAANVTADFGAASEPTADYMNAMLKMYPDKYFTGTQNVYPLRSLAEDVANGYAVIDDKFDAFVQTNIVQTEVAAVFDNLEETYAQDIVSLGEQLAETNAQVDLLNRGLGETISSLALLNSTYPTGDTKDHIVAGNIAEVDALTVTAIPTVASTITITLNGVAKTVAVDPAIQTTTDLVATAIRGTTFTGWTTGGTGSVVTFTATATGVKTVPTFSGGTTGVTAIFVVTIKGENANYHRYFWDGIWKDGGVYQAIEVTNRAITDTKISLDTELVFKKPAKNLLNIASFTDNVYVNYTNGALVANTGLVVFDDVYLEPNTDYVLSRNATGPIEQFALLNLDKQWVNGVLPASDLVEYSFNTGTAISYLRLSGRKTKYPNQQLQIEKGTVRTEYNVYESPTIKVAEIEKNAITTDYLSPEVNALIGASAENSVLVDALGGGDFTTIRAAVDSITDASSTKQYTIYINEGTYDLFSAYTPEEILATSFLGVVKKNYVSFVGTGRKEQTILRGVLADDALSTTISRVAPIVAYGEGTFENLTIIGKNTRYAVHDDYNYPNTKRRVINCDIIKEPGLGLTPAYGAGCYSGMEYEFIDTKFYTQTTGYPFSFHNNVSFAKGAKFKIDNCTFESNNGEWVIRIGSMGSGQTDTVEMVNCKIGGKILLNEENAGSGVGIDFKLTGYGNTKVPVDIINTSAEQATYEFLGETERVWNQSFGTILKGKPVKLTTKGCPVLPLATTDSPLLYAGIACEDIESFTFGVIRRSGYLPVADTGLTVAIGDKIGIVSGALAVVTTGDYIGYVELANYITLK